MAAKSPYTDAQKKQALELAARVNVAEAARRLGIPRPTISEWVNRTDQSHRDSRESLARDDRIRELESLLKTIHRDNLTTEVVREKIIGLKKEIPDPPKWTIKSQGKGTPGVPSVMWSDWHWGEVVERNQVNGLNEYNLAIAQRRSKTLVEKTIYLCRLHAAGNKYPGIVVNLGGDMLSGDIHEELTETNEEPLMKTLVDLMGVLIWALNQMADEFSQVFVPCVVGNHGRNTRKPRMKNMVYSNFDWLLYTFLAKHFEADKRFTFMIPEGADADYVVLGHRYRLSHGDRLGVKGGDGIIGALGPILRGQFKTRNSAASVGSPFDTLVIGHWHQYLPLRRVIVNGCLKGFDEFALLALRAEPEEPCQALWFTHSDHGIISHWPCYVENSPTKSNVEWIAWPKAS